MASLFFVPAGPAINGLVYLEKCINMRVIPFIKEYHSDGNWVFWPDKASSHYANKVISSLNAENIIFLPKIDNPSKLPEARSIEDCRSILKWEVYKNNLKANNVVQLKERIKYCVKNVNLNLIQKLTEGVYRRLDRIPRNGFPECFGSYSEPKQLYLNYKSCILTERPSQLIKINTFV